MNPEIYRNRLTSFAVQTVIRKLLLIAVPTVAAGIVAWTLVGDGVQIVTSRQAMTLRNVDWSNLASAHEANAAWLDENEAIVLGSTTDGDVSVRVVLPDNRQITLFSIEALAADEAGALKAVELATEVLAADPDFFGDRDFELDRLEVELEQANTRVESLSDELVELRTSNEAAAENDRTFDADRLRQEAELVEARLRQWDQRASELELRAATEQNEPRAANQPIGEPEIEAPAAVTSSRLAGGLASFVVGVTLASAVLFFTRTRGKVRSTAHLGLLAPSAYVVAMDATKAAESVAAITATLANKASDGMVAVVDVSEGGAANQVTELLTERLTRISVPVTRPKSAEDIIQFEHVATDSKGGRPAVVCPRLEGEALIATVAFCTHVILVATKGQSNSKEVAGVVDRMNRMGVEILAFVLLSPGRNAIELDDDGRFVEEGQPKQRVQRLSNAPR